MAIPRLDSFDLKSLDFESKIKAKPEKKPQFTVIYGKGGVGKSSLYCYAESPIIIPVGRETGNEKMHVPKFPNADEMNLSAINHVFACMAWAIKNDHSRKTMIISNLGSFREAVDEDVEESSGKDVDLKAYGKGAALAYPYYTKLLAGIDQIMKKRDMNVILEAHEGPYNVNLPDGSYFSRISINAPRGENTNVQGLIEARAHNVFYMREEALAIADKRGIVNKDGPTKKYATSGATRRIIYTKPRGEFFSKSRANLEDFYEIDNSDTEDELLKNRTNQSIIKLFEDINK